MNCVICQNPTSKSTHIYKAKRIHCGELICRFKTLITIDDNGCWNWHKKRTNGNLLFHIGRSKGFSARRWIWFEFYKKHITQDHHIFYNCGNNMCVNPEHLIEKHASEVSRITNKAHTRFTIQIIKNIIELHDKGWSFRGIAKIHNCNPNTISNLYHKYKQYEKTIDTQIINSDEKMQIFIDELNKQFENI
jgi:DNA-binding transcriptional regulator YhcF (GntR family)